MQTGSSEPSGIAGFDINTTELIIIITLMILIIFAAITFLIWLVKKNNK